MKPRALLLALAAGAVLLAGCQTVDSRIREKSAVFAGLDPATQAKIRQGVVDPGFDEDMVYLALGPPDRRREIRTADGVKTVWIYRTYYLRDDWPGYGPAFHDLYYDPYWRAYRYAYPPFVLDRYHEEHEDRIRVEFRDGKVTMIEQAKG